MKQPYIGRLEDSDINIYDAIITDNEIDVTIKIDSLSDNQKGVIFIYPIRHKANLTNYCYYNNDYEKEMFKRISTNGIDLDEISIKFNEYLIKDIIEWAIELNSCINIKKYLHEDGVYIGNHSGYNHLCYYIDNYMFYYNEQTEDKMWQKISDIVGELFMTYDDFYKYYVISEIIE